MGDLSALSSGDGVYVVTATLCALDRLNFPRDQKIRHLTGYEGESPSIQAPYR